MHVKYFWFSKKVLKLHLSPSSTPVVDNLKCKVSKIWKVGNASTGHALSSNNDRRGSIGTSTSSSLSSSRFNSFVKWLNSPLLPKEDKDEGRKSALDSAAHLCFDSEICKCHISRQPIIHALRPSGNERYIILVVENIDPVSFESLPRSLGSFKVILVKSRTCTRAGYF